MAIRNDFAPGEVLAAADLNDTFGSKLDVSAYEQPGLEFITSQSFSAVSSVSVNNCFSSTYDSYQIVCFASGTPNGGFISIRFRASGSDNTDSTYNAQRLTAENTTLIGARATSSTSAIIASLDDDDDANAFTATVFRPNVATRTSLSSHAFMPFGGAYMMLTAGYFDNNNVFDGFTFFPNTGTMTGNFRIYGYRN
jgi:hypothetical protein